MMIRRISASAVYLPAAAFLWLLGAGQAAYADGTLAGGPIYAGGSQTTAVCYVFNVGNGSAYFQKLQIISENGTIFQGGTLKGTSCPASTSPFSEGKSCYLSATIGGGQSYSCRVSYTGNGVNLTGSMDLRDGDGNASVTIALQQKP
ncbi:MAG: hypothetical protein J0I77_02830 [Rudaea sp.]|uniref:hypothetical protein n=1 Tax=unclassified Rudaea TaxID=2627037 RepID=UPI0010F786BB|nr:MULTISPECIES: hypothetical protein [unclassified Rudaea]MBN8884633.1 hypothetical protein [Rudaea sp.]